MESSNVARFLLEAAQAHPRQTGLIVPAELSSWGERRLDFAALDILTRGAAARLASRGIQRGMRVSVLVKPGLGLILVVFALFRLGAVPVVIDPGMPRRKFFACLERTQPEALVGIRPAVWLSRLPLRALRTVRFRVTISSAFERQAEAFARDPAVEVTPVATEPDELAAILFTSGSTGPPKGVCYHHGAFNAQVSAIREAFGIEPGEIDLPMLPVFALFNPALGMATVVPPINPSRPASANPALVFATIERYQVTTSFGSPALWARLADYCLAQGLTLPSVRRVLMAGAPAPFRLLERLRECLPHARIHTPYGATEVLPVASIEASEVLGETAHRTAKGEGTCVGSPLPGVAVRILPPNARATPEGVFPKSLGTGEVGEIVVTGPTVTRAYDRLPEATASAKLLAAEAPGQAAQTWHRMGDAGWLDESGRLWFLGRLAERVTTAAGSVDTERVEGIVNAVPGIRRSALIGFGPPGQQQPAIAIEVISPASDEAPNGLQGLLEARWPALQARLHAIRCPVYRVEAMPVDVRHNAKIHRLTLADSLRAATPWFTFGAGE